MFSNAEVRDGRVALWQKKQDKFREELSKYFTRNGSSLFSKVTDNYILHVFINYQYGIQVALFNQSERKDVEKYEFPATHTGRALRKAKQLLVKISLIGE